MQDLEEIFGGTGPLARAVAGFRPRAMQLQMAEQVALALAERRWLVAEAGTGTGKTYAYLVPALLSGKRVIISTGTRTLQDQLFHRDLPMLAQALGRGTSVALLKGRANYLCRERFARLHNGVLPLEAETTALGAKLKQWADTTAEGDLAEFAELADGNPMREKITSTRDSCTGNRCAEFSRCHVFAARRRANEADVVVVNHHLLLADLALKEEGFGDILPSVDAVVLDEAHQLPDLAAQFFGSACSSRKVEQWLLDLPPALLESGLDAQRLSKQEAALRNALQKAVREVSMVVPSGQRVAWEDNFATVDTAVRELVTRLCDLADALRSLDGGDTLTALALRATELAGEFDTIADAAPSAGARLLSASARGFQCQIIPFNVGETLRAILMAKPMAWIFTSATLAVAGDFSHFIGRLGLTDRCDTLCIDSPFDFSKQALLYVPTGMPEPTSAEYSAAVVRCAAELVDIAKGGAFLLFTSHRALEFAARQLRALWKSQGSGYHLLVQGEGGREQLLREFRDHGNAVLLGTASFWEGVDVKGDALRLVVIDRLPFASPEDPVTKSRLQRSREQGGNPFNDFQLPEAAITLKQGVGRLIRSEADTGVIAICDPRLLSKGYGKQLLASLPPMRRSRDILDVRDMLAPKPKRKRVSA
jgi:ATP-dependent DNA helicase DinG